MSWSEFIARNRKVLEQSSPYELLFVESVLQHVPGLEPKAVTVQHPFVDDERRARRIDFAVVEGEHVRIALEVDGFDKTGRGTGMTRAEFEDFLRRETSLTRQGWRLLRFSNVSVRDRPASCARQIELALHRERGVAAELERARSRGGSARDQQAPPGLSGREAAELAGLEAQNERALAELRGELREARTEARQQRSETNNMGKVALAIAAVAIAAIWALVTVTGRNASVVATLPVAAPPMAPVVSPPADARAVSILPASINTPSPERREATLPTGIELPAAEAKRAIGQTATICGVIVEATMPRVNGDPTYLNFDARFPNTPFMAVIWRRNRDNFPARPDELYRGRKLCVTGPVTEYRGVPQMELRSPSAVQMRPE